MSLELHLGNRMAVVDYGDRHRERKRDKELRGAVVSSQGELEVKVNLHWKQQQFRGGGAFHSWTTLLLILIRNCQFYHFPQSLEYSQFSSILINLRFCFRAKTKYFQSDCCVVRAWTECRQFILGGPPAALAGCTGLMHFSLFLS